MLGNEVEFTEYTKPVLYHWTSSLAQLIHSFTHSFIHSLFIHAGSFETSYHGFQAILKLVAILMSQPSEGCVGRCEPCLGLQVWAMAVIAGVSHGCDNRCEPWLWWQVWAMAVMTGVSHGCDARYEPWLWCQVWAMISNFLFENFYFETRSTTFSKQVLNYGTLVSTFLQSWDDRDVTVPGLKYGFSRYDILSNQSFNYHLCKYITFSITI